MKYTREQLIEKIAELEIQASKIAAAAGANIMYAGRFPEYLKLTRKINKLRDKL